MEERKSNDELFKDVRFYAIGDLDSKIKDKLLKKKAKEESYLQTLVTHAIISDPDHYEAEEAQDVWQIPTVSPNWVEMSVNCNQLLPTEGFSISTTQLFSNYTVSFSNLSKKDKERLWSLVTFYGGKCQTILNKTVTHLVVASPKGSKYDTAMKHSVICVAPDWLLHCVKQKKTIDTAQYHPRLNIIPEVKQSPEIETKTVEHGIKEMSVTASITGGKSVETTSKLLPMESSKAAVGSGKTSAVSSLPQPPQSTTLQKPSQSVTPGRLMPGPPFSPTNPQMMQQMRFAALPPQQFRQATTPNNPRFFPTSHPLRSPMAPNHTAMLSSAVTSHTYPTSPAQGFGMMSPNQMMMTTGGQQQSMIVPQQQPIISPNQQQAFMSPSPKSSLGSPRRNSGGQTPGSKKKKSQSQSNRMSPHASIRQVHVSQQAFPSKQQVGQFSPQQQQMMMKNRMPLSMDQSGMMMQKVGDVKPNMAMGLRPGAVMQGRFPSGDFPPNMQPQQQHQMMQLQLQQQQQQQQQQFRMNMIRQPSPGSQTSPHNAMDPMGQNWPRPNMEGTAFPANQHIFPGQQQPNNFPQGQMQPQGHQFMINRMQGQPPSQQQFMFQERSPGSMAATCFPTTSSLEAAGIAGISPIALQQGIMNSQHHDQPALIHPSLQGTLFPKVTNGQQSSGTAPKKRSKSRKKTDTGEEETKPKPRSRNKPKKPQTPPSANALMQSQIGSHPPSMPPQAQFRPQGVMPPHSHVMMPSTVGTMHTVGGPPGFMQGNQQPQAPHLQLPNQHRSQQIMQMPIPNQQQQQQHQQHPTTIQQVAHAPMQVASQHPPLHNQQQPINVAVSEAQEMITHFMEGALKRHPTPAPPLPPHSGRESDQLRGKLIDPLLCSVKEIDGKYVTRDKSERVPSDLFLLGCIFYIHEYDGFLTDLSVLELWKKMIQKYGGVVEAVYTNACTHVICASATTPLFGQALADRKRCVTVYWLNDVLQIRNLRVPWLAIHLPTPYPWNQKPATKQTISFTGFHAKERERLKMMAFVCGAKFTGSFTRSNTALLCKLKGKSLKFDKAREWMVPCVTLRWLRDTLQSTEEVDVMQPKYRSYHDDAETLHGMILDFTKSQHLLEAWKAFIQISPDTLAKSQVKRKSDLFPPSPLLPKCPRTSGCYEALPRVCFTGFDPMTAQDLSKKIIALNGRVETTLTLCTHLVANRVSRSVKFLSCISSCSFVVTHEWIEESFKCNMLLDEEKFFLVDKTAEAGLNFSLRESIKRAKGGPLFKDCLFAITPKVVPERSILRQIVECAGGKILSKMPTLAVLKHVNTRPTPHTRIYLVSCPDDEKVYQPLKKEGISIHNAEIILSGALKQVINTEAFRL